MSRLKTGIFTALFLITVLLGGSTLCQPQTAKSGSRSLSQTPTPAPSTACAKGQMRCVTEADRAAAAQRAAAQRATVGRGLSGPEIDSLP